MTPIIALLLRQNPDDHHRHHSIPGKPARPWWQTTSWIGLILLGAFNLYAAGAAGTGLHAQPGPTEKRSDKWRICTGRPRRSHNL